MLTPSESLLIALAERGEGEAFCAGVVLAHEYPEVARDLIACLSNHQKADAVETYTELRVSLARLLVGTGFTHPRVQAVANVN